MFKYHFHFESLSESNGLSIKTNSFIDMECALAVLDLSNGWSCFVR